MKRILKRVAVVLAVSLSIIGPGAIAHAEPGSCRSSDTGCTRWYRSVTSGSNQDTYRFNSQDPDMGNNWYVTELCSPKTPLFPPCVADLNVKNHNGAMQLNSTSYVRMCIYANTNYANALYWVQSRGAMYTTGQTAVSLRYRTSASC